MEAQELVLPEPVWRARAEAHARAVDELTRARLERRRRGLRHPVEDFLFEYYGHRPGQLARWHPGPGVALLGAAEREGWSGYTYDGRAARVDLATLLARRGGAVRFVVDLLEATLSRPGRYGCFGLHEWAMVYRADEASLRHTGWPLRLGREGTDRVVETSRISCSHFDAYRFFTPEAAPRNTLRPTREGQLALEQPGCLHAGMDLYKWALKLGPAVPGDLLLDAFELARDIRYTDMAAAPYDVSSYGVAAVAIETPE
ncbi:MAG TPA: 3-methyladenine DNA glycosylase, partial [Ornithinicoccus sp.]|nr:3-methyladenine DNA glycosylase [Ornithinicoccus sp.]